MRDTPSFSELELGSTRSGRKSDGSSSPSHTVWMRDASTVVASRSSSSALSDRAVTEDVNAYSLGVLDIRQEEQAAEKRAQFAATWDKASRKKLRSWLS